VFPPLITLNLLQAKAEGMHLVCKVTTMNQQRLPRGTGRHHVIRAIASV
jgi:hypothetical protein